MTWYKDWFGKDYLKVYPHRDEQEARRQVAFVTKVLRLTPDMRILDLGCGSGRHALEMSRRGFHITCLDLSTVLLTLAKQRSAQENCCCPRFVRADMRYLPFSGSFGAVLSFFTTFGYFKTDAENWQTLKNIEGVLKPQGQFFLDYLNKSYVVDNLVPYDSRREDGFEIIQQRSYNKQEERIEKKIILKENGQIREYFESVRLYTIDEMKQLLANTALVLEKTYGDFDGSSFSDKRPRLILVGRKE